MALIIPSKLPGTDYVINPYLGCGFGCKYCYAKFMSRLVNKPQQDWGTWVIPKLKRTRDWRLFKKEIIQKQARIENSKILMSSVTDAYQPIEARLKITRRIL